MRKTRDTGIPGSAQNLLFFAFILFCVLPVGCKRSEPGAEGGGAEAYDTGLTPESTPSEVVELAIKGLDEGNKELLLALVAAKDAAKGMDEIYRKYGKESPISSEATAGMAVAGWGMTYSFFRKGATEIVEEQINGDKAAVRARGVYDKTGKPGMLRFDLIREDGLWKIKAGLHAEQASP